MNLQTLWTNLDAKTCADRLRDRLCSGSSKSAVDRVIQGSVADQGYFLFTNRRPPHVCARGRFVPQPQGGTRIDIDLSMCGLSRVLVWIGNAIMIAFIVMASRTDYSSEVDGPLFVGLIFLMLFVALFITALIGKVVNRLAPRHERERLITFVAETL